MQKVMDRFDLRKALQERILILDGAMGTMVQRHHLSKSDYHGERFRDHEINLSGNNDLLSLTQPQIIEDIHRQYLEAGADIIETCTFGAQRISQSGYGLEGLVREMNVAAAQNARRAVDKFLSSPSGTGRQAWVAGSIGPTGKTLSMSPDAADPARRNLSFDELAEAYLEQILALQEGGVDLFLVETIFDALNAKAAIYALDLAAEQTGRRLPLMISVTIADKSGRTLCGQTLEAFWASIAHAHPLLMGINCALGAEEMRPYLRLLSGMVNCAVSCYPNAGLPNANGGYDETPQHMASVLAEYAKVGWLNLAGGCCGTSPDYIRAIAEALKDLKPRPIPDNQAMPALLSGLEIYRIAGSDRLEMGALDSRVEAESSVSAGGEVEAVQARKSRQPNEAAQRHGNSGSALTFIGERCNLSGSAKFARLIRNGDYEAAIAVARRQVENGANVLDINLDDAMHDTVEVMQHFLRLLTAEPDIAAVPIMIDSSHWEVLQAGLKCLAGRSLVNSISLKEGEAEFKRRAKEIRRLGGLTVAMCFDEKGQGDTLARKREIVDRICHILLEELHFSPREIVIDLAVLAVATGIESHANYGRDFIEATAYVNSRWPGVMTNAGVSNVSFSLRGNNPAREAMHSVFLHHACRAGLTMGIVNAGLLRNYDELAPDLRQAVEDAILNTHPGAAEILLEVAEKHRGDTAAKSVTEHDSWRAATVAERLKTALVRGFTDYLEEDIKEAAESGMRPIDIIEQALMGGMHEVGELFGAGRMFLPQVVKSARVMKKAVACLEPYFKDSPQGDNLRGRIIMATVKGDVHDIGKNIVSVVLGCNGFQIEDLGVMVPAEAIVQKIKETDAQLLGLSALITPSLDEIINVIISLENAGIRIPVLVGGAATSPVHTAVKIAPHYSGVVIRIADASLVTESVNNLLNKETRDLYIAKVREEQQKLGLEWQTRMENLKLRTFEQAQELAPRFHWQVDTDIIHPEDPGVKSIDFNLADLVQYIDWGELLKAWGLNGAYPQILEDQEQGAQAAKLYQDGRSILEYIVKTQALKVRGVYGLFPAQGRCNDILLYENVNDSEPRFIIPTLRQQRGDVEVCLALSDFVTPCEVGCRDWLGVFAVSAGFGLEKLRASYEENNDEYHAIMAGFLADRFCEAASLYLHKLVRTQCGLTDPAGQTVKDLLLQRHRGIRPAPGYPACPDHTLKKVIWQLLEPERRIGLNLTDSCAMYPANSVSGLYFFAPQARYFSLGRIGRDQVEDYSKRCGRSVEETEHWLANNLA